MSQSSEGKRGTDVAPAPGAPGESEQPPPDINAPIAVFNHSRPRIIGLMAAAGFAALVGAAMAFGAIPVRGGLGTAVGYFAMLFFGAGVIVYLFRLFDAAPVIVVSRRGLYDRRLAPDFIPWSEFTSLRRGVADRAEYVLFELDSGAEARLGISPLMRLRGRLNGPRKWRGYAVSVTGLDSSINDLVSAINTALAGQEQAPS